MNTKSFLLSGIAGTIVYYLLGGLFYGVLFKDIYPEESSMLHIALGCLFTAFAYALIFNKWAQISTFKTGAMAGLMIGLLLAISMNFFMNSSQEIDITKFITGVLIDTVSIAIMGGVIGLVIGKTK